MAKIYTKSKRAKKLRSTTIKHRFWFTRVEKRRGPKSFPSKEKAEAWATAHGLDKDAHMLHVLKTKFQWRRRPRV